MPHVFQLFSFHPAARNAMKRTGAFIRKIIPETTNDTSSSSSHSSFSSFSSSHTTSSYHHHQEVREKDVPKNTLKLKTSSLSLQEFFEDELDDINDYGEINFFTNKYIDVKGNCKRRNDMLDEGTLREWINMLGKLPDLEAHPEFMDI